MLHVRDIGLDESPDTSIWRYAWQHGYDLLTKDEDSVRVLLAEGFPEATNKVLSYLGEQDSASY